jgi:tRNA(fMet)-specific endonuclease VapC
LRLLDTSVCIDVTRGRPESAERLRRSVAAGAVALSTLVLLELRTGVLRRPDKRRYAEALQAFLSGPHWTVLPFEDADAEAAARTRAYLLGVGQPIGPYDLLIAAQALRHEAVLVTSNLREFARVPGLVVEDWTADA